MGLNPNIILSVDPIDMDPTQARLRGQQLRLQNAQIQNAEMELQRKRGLIEFLKRTPTQDPNFVGPLQPSTNMNTRGDLSQLLQYGDEGRQLYNSLQDQRKLEIDEKKFKETQLKDELERFYKDTITIDTPEQAKQHLMNMQNNPLLSEFIGRNPGKIEQELVEIDNAVQAGTFPEYLNKMKLGVEALKPHYISQNLGGKERVLSVLPGGKASVVEGSEGVVTRSPNAPQTNINVSNKTESAYGQELGKKMAEEDSKLNQRAASANRSLKRLNKMEQLLDSGKVKTGAFANTRLGLAKGLSLIGAADKESVAQTEEFKSALSAELLDAAKIYEFALNQGFSNKDMEVLKSASSGDLDFSEQGLRQLINSARRVRRDLIDSWNERIKELPQEAGDTLGIKPVSKDIPQPGKEKDRFVVGKKYRFGNVVKTYTGNGKWQ